MNFVINTLVKLLVINNVINDDLKEEYIYALEKIFERTISYVSLFLLSMCFDMVLPTLIFLLCFCSLRNCTGGFHLNSYLACLLSTIAIYVIFIKAIYPWLYENFKYLPGSLVVSLLVILVLGAVNHPNMCWNKVELQEAKKAARTLIGLQSLCILSCIALKVNKACIIFAIFGVILCAVSLIVAKILKQEVRV